jgi:hypothetical protein
MPACSDGGVLRVLSPRIGRQCVVARVRGVHGRCRGRAGAARVRG